MEVEKRGLSCLKRKTLEKRTILVDEKAYRELKRKKAEAFSLEELMFLEFLTGDD